MKPEDVPDDLVDLFDKGSYERCRAYTGNSPTVSENEYFRGGLAAVLPVHKAMVRAEWFKELFGDPVERLKEPMRPDSREEIIGRMLDHLTLDELRRVAQTAADRITRGEGR